MARTDREPRLSTERLDEAKTEKAGARDAALLKMSQEKDGKAVLFSATMYKITKIDPVAQRFSCEFGVHMYWFEEALVNWPFEEGQEVLYLDPIQHKDKLLVPTLNYENVRTLVSIPRPLGYSPLPCFPYASC